VRRRVSAEEREQTDLLVDGHDLGERVERALSLPSLDVLERLGGVGRERYLLAGEGRDVGRRSRAEGARHQAWIVSRNDGEGGNALEAADSPAHEVRRHRRRLLERDELPLGRLARRLVHLVGELALLAREESGGRSAGGLERARRWPARGLGRVGERVEADRADEGDGEGRLLGRVVETGLLGCESQGERDSQWAKGDAQMLCARL